MDVGTRGEGERVVAMQENVRAHLLNREGIKVCRGASVTCKRLATRLVCRGTHAV